MKFRLCLLTLLLALVFSFPPLSESSENGHLPSPSGTTNSGYKVENLSADIYAEGTILLVKGEVRNLRLTPTSGYIIVHLQTENREEIGSVETELNKNDTILPGFTGQIEVAINIAQFPKIKNVSIEFISR